MRRRSLLVSCVVLAVLEGSSLRASSVAAAPAASPAPPPGMVLVPAGEFWMGTEEPSMTDARPLHRVWVDAFWMDRTEVTNEQFQRFVDATKHVTVAERPLDPEDFPGVPPEALKPGSIVFTPPDAPVPLQDHLAWWSYVPGASWRHPEGPQSDVKNRPLHPVVHVAYEDAAAYCAWAGKRLPTEAEFERAARGGLDRKKYDWGDELRPGGKPQANTWQGHFPNENSKEDGYVGTAPVASYPANPFGLYDLAGNVWEWCSDWYRPDTYAKDAAAGEVTRNPQGPADSFDPQEPGVAKRVHRGGSYLCSDQYCSRYVPGGRGKGAIDSGTTHLGFRCVRGGGDAPHASPPPNGAAAAAKTGG
ncbi:formylglycine-generating enzyme family protein [Candidatus Binatia bacterium]|nr:formylglycine-generating enzyme family protein [Candidatus Binatia bacterium]